MTDALTPKALVTELAKWAQHGKLCAVEQWEPEDEEDFDVPDCNCGLVLLLKQAADYVGHQQPAPDVARDNYGRPQSPDGYAYRYHEAMGDVLRFNRGGAVNGGLPFECVPYWLGKAPRPLWIGIDLAAPDAEKATGS